eukprot:TRINITY_DN369_c0_g1_i2.p1 TRINITY_DN369_c0_g1~~TRINITY_DN369_c0_g1_i2.p1  ORF type:complete len:386 (+),score=64.15 TRINITY_DN369_c0_g1_i2:42-1199(+)
MFVVVLILGSAFLAAGQPQPVCNNYNNYFSQSGYLACASSGVTSQCYSCGTQISSFYNLLLNDANCTLFAFSIWLTFSWDAKNSLTCAQELNAAPYNVSSQNLLLNYFYSPTQYIAWNSTTCAGSSYCTVGYFNSSGFVNPTTFSPIANNYTASCGLNSSQVSLCGGPLRFANYSGPAYFGGTSGSVGGSFLGNCSNFETYLNQSGLNSTTCTKLMNTTSMSGPTNSFYQNFCSSCSTQINNFYKLLLADANCTAASKSVKYAVGYDSRTSNYCPVDLDTAPYNQTFTYLQTNYNVARGFSTAAMVQWNSTTCAFASYCHAGYLDVYSTSGNNTAATQVISDFTSKCGLSSGSINMCNIKAAVVPSLSLTLIVIGVALAMLFGFM